MAEVPTRTAVEAEISREIARIHEESYGETKSVLTHVLDDAVVVLIDPELTPAEETLVAADREDAVKTNREAYQQAIRASFTAVVERATGRRVDAFLSSMAVDPPFAAEVFRLGPRRL